jgi:hypothetical protein
MNFRTQTVLSKGPFFFTFRSAGRKIVAIFIHSKHYKSASLQRTCTVVRSQDIYVYYELAENAVEVDNTHGWGTCVGMFGSTSWYSMLVYRKGARAHARTHTHKHTNCPNCFTSHTAVFWGVCHSATLTLKVCSMCYCLHCLQRHRNYKAR